MAFWMAIELSHLMQLVAGQKQVLTVGDLPRSVAAAVGCHPAVVYLGHREVLKIVRAHGDGVGVEQLQCLTFAVSDAEYRLDSMRKNALSLYYQNPIDKEFYVVGLKHASGRREVWVSTFFRTSENKQRAQRQRAELLRAQKLVPARNFTACELWGLRESFYVLR